MICAILSILFWSSALAEDDNQVPPKCLQDAMLVFDASGSMSGIDEGGTGRLTTRIDDARTALEKSLPRVTPYRRLGLMTYGPGGHCKVSLDIRPAFNTAPGIVAQIKKLSPDGLTPLSMAVAQAADVLSYRKKGAMIVLLTDGAETCGGQPCELAKNLTATGEAITVHVIGYRMQDLISVRDQGFKDMKCLAEQTGGHFISADSINELVDALNKTLGCPLVAERKSHRDFDFASVLWQKPR